MGPGVRCWVEGEVSSTCLLQEPPQDIGSREPQGQPWAGQVFLLATAAGREALASSEAWAWVQPPARQIESVATAWFTSHQSTYITIAFYLVRTMSSNATTASELSEQSFKNTCALGDSPVPWETLIQKVWVEIGYLHCKKHHRTVQPELRRHTSWETQCLQDVKYFTLWLYPFKDEVWKGCLNKHRTGWSWSQFVLPWN